MASTKVGIAAGGKNIQAKRKTITRTQTTATQVATLPRGAVLLGFVLSGVASNAGTTATLSIGSTAANANEYVNAANVLAAGVGNGVQLLNGVAGAVGSMPAGGIPTTAPLPIFVKYAETGVASSAGSWKLWILYTTGNDVYDDSV
ncbi:MAG: hypothetical protein ACYC9R_12725 [Nitrosotalea sp.]